MRRQVAAGVRGAVVESERAGVVCRGRAAGGRPDGVMDELPRDRAAYR